MLGLVMDHIVRPRDQQLHRLNNCVSVTHYPPGCLMQPQQNVHRNGAGNERVFLIAGNPFRVVGKKAGFDITVNKEVAEQTGHQRECGPGQGHVKLYFEGGGRQGEPTNPRRIIVCPGSRQHCTYALGNHIHVLLGEAMAAFQVLHKALQVTHRRAVAGTVAPLPW